MTGKPGLNFLAFHAAAAELRALDVGHTVGWGGIQVVNPADLNPDPNTSWRECMATDIKALVDCDTVLMLPGWLESRGASLERKIAIRLGMLVFYDIGALRAYVAQQMEQAA